MRIAYIYTALTTLGGVDRVLSIKANFLADKLGHEVFIITDSQAGRAPIFPLSPRVRHIDLETDFDEQYHHGIIRRYFIYRRLMKQYRQRLEQTLADIAPDITCSTLGREMDFLTELHDGSIKIGESHIAKNFCRNLHLMEARGFPYNIVARMWRRRLEKAVAKLDALVVLTERDAMNWAAVRPAIVIHNPCTIEPHGLASVSESKTVVAVGRLSEQKALDRLVKAWAGVGSQHPDWQLLIYGEGEKQAELQQLITELGLASSCHLCGTTNDVASIYASASVYAMTSRFEGFPLVLIEAMTCGLPVVAMDCPTGTREIIENEVNGILVPDGDIDAMTEALNRIIGEPTLRQKLATASLESALSRFSIEPIMNRWNTLFASLVNRKANILYVVFHGFEPNSGITKKIHNQVKGLQQLGHTVHLCHYGFDERSHRVRWIDDKVIADYGKGPLAAIRSRFGLGCIDRWCRQNGIDMVYVRSFHNASPQTVALMRRLRRAGIPVALEIPTYPYDSEYVGFPWREQLKLFIDCRFRHQLAKNVSAIVTFSDCQRIFGQRTIRISNGVNFDELPLAVRTPHANTVHLTAVAEVHYWHGLDRLIDGLGQYYASTPKREVVFHVVGGVGPSEMHDSQHAPGFAELIERWHLQDKVVFHGQLFGDELTAVFNQTDLAIGSLARHRSSITTIKTLKNREYAARGIPFIYSEQDSDFDHQPYVMRVPADESPISIPSLLEFLDKQTIQPEEIRASVVHLSWAEQMRIVVDSLKKP